MRPLRRSTSPLPPLPPLPGFLHLLLLLRSELPLNQAELHSALCTLLDLSPTSQRPKVCPYPLVDLVDALIICQFCKFAMATRY